MRASLRYLALGLAGALGVTGTALGGSAAVAREERQHERHGPPVAAEPPKVPTMTGSGGAVSSVDPLASQAGIDVLERGGNAADAAVAAAAVLGVTEPYSAGIGGGGFFVHYDAGTGEVRTIDGRETAPATYTEDEFLGADGEPLDFATVVSSGKSVGVPGTPATWEAASEEFGTMDLDRLLRPAERIAARGFAVDENFAEQTAQNAERFRMFPETAQVFLRDGEAPEVGTVFRNPDLARTYRTIRTHGVDAFYEGSIGRAVVDEVRDPTTAEGVDVFAGELTEDDVAAYEAVFRDPVSTEYRGLDVYGMGVPSSGGIAVAETLNLLEAYDERTGEDLSEVSEAQYLHRFSEATATAFADRNRWVGDVAGVPVEELTSQEFADERACLFDPAAALPRPIPFGEPDGDYAACAPSGARQPEAAGGVSTTHLNVADRWGNVVSYTLTIEQTGGSGITVPDHGFLLNNELTDFNFAPVTEGVKDPNLPAPGKRPRSSMSPTIILRDGEPWMSVGTPGGATIITTVGQIITGHVDRDLPLVDAIAAPRLSSRNGPEEADLGLADSAVGRQLSGLGHELVPPPRRWIGNASAIRILERGRFTSAAETERGYGGSAMVVRPDRER
ncbi:MAG TPA: gamma-glutamyltransferase [Kocuria rosea]|jgi:gamma-glutamyltranspeptidase/glutathione hydrolase|nr:gamma-glutamyltransferase [Kocuria rosea]